MTLNDLLAILILVGVLLTFAYGKLKGKIENENN